MVARDQDDRGLGEGLAQAGQFPEGEENGRVAGPDRMEDVAGQENGIRPLGNDAIDRGPEGVGHVGFALVQAGGGLPVELAKSEVQIGEVGELHAMKGKSRACRRKNQRLTTSTPAR